MVESRLESSIGYQLPIVPAKDMLIPSENVYSAFRTCNITRLESVPPDQLLPILPSLVRLALYPPLDKSDFWYRQSKRFTHLISSHPAANFLSSLASIDYAALEEDTVKSIALVNKISTLESQQTPAPSLLIGNIRELTLLDFEKSNPDRKMRLLAAELVRLHYQSDSFAGDKHTPSELLLISPYLPVLSRLLVHLTHQLPNLFPLPALCEALIKVSSGAELVCSVAANNPNDFENILFSLLTGDESEDDQLQFNPLRMKTLCLLCSMSPAYYSILRKKCTELKKHLNIALVLALEESMLHSLPTTHAETGPGLEIELPSFSMDSLLSQPSHTNGPVLDYLSAVLLSSSDDNCWVSLYLKQALRKNIPSRIFTCVKQHVIDHLLQAIPELSEGVKETVFKSPPPDQMDSDSPHETREHMQVGEGVSPVATLSLTPSQRSVAASVLRVFCILRRLCPLPPSQQETDVTLNLIITPSLSTQDGDEFLKVALGALLLCPAFYPGDKEELVLEWYHKLILLIPPADAKDFHLTELLLTVHTLSLHSNQQALVELLSDLMSIPLRNKSYQVTKSKEIFLKVFTEEKCSHMTLSLPPTPNLNANHTDKFSIQSLLDFLKKKTLAPNLQPTQWIFKQILQCTLPLHSTMLLILKEYNSVIIREAGKKTPSVVDLLFPRDSVIKIYNNSSLLHNDNLAAQLLLLLYLLTLFSDENIPVSSPVSEYAVSILDHVPVKMLLSKAISQATQCSELYPLLLKLIIDSLPQLWLPQNVLREFNYVQSGMKLDTKCIPAHFDKTMNQRNRNLNVVFVLLKQLLNLHVDKLREFLTVLVELIPVLLSRTMARQTQNIYLTLWERLESVEPRRLWLATANCLTEMERELTHDELALDPLLILHCDSAVFRVPPIFSLLLDTLVAYLAASRVYLYRIERQRELQGTHPPSLEGYELRQTIISTQESAVIQSLIDICVPTDEDKSSQGLFGMQMSNLTEIQCLSCCLINQMFIADPNLACIIHSQGYPDHMIEMLVQGVPPMHICIDFIPGLLEETDSPSSLVFCVKLTACLCEQYPLPKAMSVCQKVLEYLNKKVRQLDSKGRSEIFRHILTSLVHFARTFPTLSEDITLLLLSILKLEQAVTPSCVDNREATIDQLEGAGSLVQAVADTFDVLLDQVILKL